MWDGPKGKILSSFEQQKAQAVGPRRIPRRSVKVNLTTLHHFYQLTECICKMVAKALYVEKVFIDATPILPDAIG